MNKNNRHRWEALGIGVASSVVADLAIKLSGRVGERRAWSHLIQLANLWVQRRDFRDIEKAVGLTILVMSAPALWEMFKRLRGSRQPNSAWDLFIHHFAMPIALVVTCTAGFTVAAELSLLAGFVP